MKPSLALLVAAAAASSAVAVAQVEYGDGCGYECGGGYVSTYTTEEPTYEYITTTYVTTYTETKYYPKPPKYVTETVTETYTEPGEPYPITETKTKYKTLPQETSTVTSTYTSPTTEVITKTKYIKKVYTTTVFVTNNVTQTFLSATTDFKTVISVSPSTVLSISEVTRTSLVTLPRTTITRDGTTVTLDPVTLTTTFTDFRTITNEVTDVVIEPTTITQPGTPVTVTQERTRVITISGSPTTVVDMETVTITQDPITISPPTLPPVTVTLLQTTVVTESGVPVTIVNTVTSVQTADAPPPVTISGEAPPPAIFTQEVQITVPITVTAPPVTVTITPGPDSCPLYGGEPTANSLGCQGRDCSIEFQEEAAVRWEENTNLPPLITAVTFINSTAKATCITTICNTKVFNSYYTQSQIGCARPPCPSNSLDCDCNIIVGPLVLRNNQTSSVTLTGTSGWNLNLGAIPTARDIGRCGSAGGECITSTASPLSSNLVYVGDVDSTTIGGNGTGQVSTRYLLPGLGNYFSPGVPFGDCTTAVLNSITFADNRLPKRQLGGGGFDAKTFTWLAAGELIQREIYRAEAVELPSTTDGPTTTEQQPTTLPSLEPTTEQIPSVEQPSETDSPVSPTTPTDESTPSSSAPPVTPTEPPPEGTETTSLATPVLPTGQGTSSDSVPPAPTSDAPPESTSPTTTSGGSIQSSVFTGTDAVTNGTFVTITETVYYSMVPGPGEQNIISAVDDLEEILSTASPSDIGSIVSSVLSFDGTPGVAPTFSDSTPTDDTPAPITTGGAASKANEPRYILTIVIVLLILLQLW